MSTHHRSSNPSTMSLYDQFLQTLSPDDGTSFKKAASPGSSTHSNRSDTDGMSEEETQQFLLKIYEPVPPSKVYGFEYDTMSLKMLLLNERSQDSFNLLGVVGMVGVGKSTLCRSVFDEKEVKQRFVPRIQINMSEEPKSMEGVVERMLEHLGLEQEFIEFISSNHKLPGLLYALYLKLKGKGYLILLDDVREEDGYYERLISCLRDGHGFPKSHGAAIIVTSRNEEAIKKMVGEQNLHRLLPLSDPESCWPIYLNVALDDHEAHLSSIVTTPKEVKEELKKKCGGLPLAARILGELKHREAPREEAPTISKGGSRQASVPEDDANFQAPKVSGDGSNETSSASKDGTKNEAYKASGSGDGLHEATASEDGQNYQESAASGDGLNEATVSEDGPNEASIVSENVSNQTSTASKDGSSQESTASNKSDIQPATN